MDAKDFKNPHQNLLHSLQVPVLVDGGVDDAACEHLLCFECQEEH